ncbi:MAG: FAD-dependent oxidoreductase [Bacillota bacterium]
MNKHQYDYIVVGAGIIGCAVAYYLSKQSSKVLLIDKLFPAAGASGACNGGLSYLGKKGELLDQAVESLLLYKELEKELETDLGKDQKGQILFFSDTPEQGQLLEEIVNECKSRTLDAKLISGTKVMESFPYLTGSISAGAIAGGGLQGVVNPFKAICGFLKKTKQNGGMLIRNEEAKEILLQGGMVYGVRTNNGEFRAPAVVVCTGYEIDRLLKPLGLASEIIATKGTVLVTGKSKMKLKANLLYAGFLENNCHSKVNLALEQTLDGNILIGSSAENSLGKEIDNQITSQIAKTALKSVPKLKNEHIIRIFSGIRPTRKGGPFIGKIPGINGLAAAFGHGGMGISLAPYTGKYLAQLLTGRG